MALIKCPECGNQISDKSSVCVHCGYPLDHITSTNETCSKFNEPACAELYTEDDVIINEEILPKSNECEKTTQNSTPAGTNNNSYDYTKVYADRAAKANKEINPVIKAIIPILVLALVFVITCWDDIGISGSDPSSELTEVSLPVNGYEFYNAVNSGDYAGISPSSFTVENKGSIDYYVKLYDLENDSTAATFFVRANSTCTIDVIPKELELRYAYGDTWYGSSHLFGEDTVYVKDNNTYDFSKYTWTVTFNTTSAEGDSLDTESISEGDF